MKVEKEWTAKEYWEAFGWSEEWTEQEIVPVNDDYGEQVDVRMYVSDYLAPDEEKQYFDNRLEWELERAKGVLSAIDKAAWCQENGYDYSREGDYCDSTFYHYWTTTWVVPIEGEYQEGKHWNNPKWGSWIDSAKGHKITPSGDAIILVIQRQKHGSGISTELTILFND